MKLFAPPQTQGLLTGIAALLLSLSLSIFSLYRLAAATLSPWLLLWVLLPLIGLPLSTTILYRLYGLLTAQYALDRNGFYLRWGLAEQHIPLGQIKSITPAEDIPLSHLSGWKGILGCTKVVHHTGQEIEFYAAGSTRNAVLLTSSSASLVLTPSDPVLFLRTYREFTYQGALQRIKPLSIRPQYLGSVLLQDRRAQWLVPSGLVVNLLLLAFLSLASHLLPEMVPFSFTPSGAVRMLAPSGSMLLLPLAGSMLWLMNFALGTWFYHSRSDHVMGYALWGVSLLPGLLLWGAVINMLSSAAG